MNLERNITDQAASPSLSKSRQKLHTMCRNVRWELLQRISRLEYEMSRVLGADVPYLFGKKAETLVEHFSSTRSKDQVVEARILLAHAEVSIVMYEMEYVSYWRLPASTSGLGSRAMELEELRNWNERITKEVDQVLGSLSAI